MSISEQLLLARQEVIATGKLLLQKNLVTGTWGNVSVRLPDARIAITPSGSDYRFLEAMDIAILDTQGKWVDGRKKPSSEWALHVSIYQERPDINAVIHTHSIFASACAVAHRPIPPIIEDLVQLAGGTIEVAEYALPGTEELAAKAVLALKDKQAVLLANHGMAGCGRSLNEALLACELVEKAAQIMVYAQSLGGAQTLSQEDVDIMHEFYQRHYSREINTHSVRGDQS